jgi:FkbM family methyltransferase
MHAAVKGPGSAKTAAYSPSELCSVVSPPMRRFPSNKLLLTAGLGCLAYPPVHRAVTSELHKVRLDDGFCRSLLSDPDHQFTFHVLAWAHKARSQLFQDVWALCESGFKSGGFFVEIGALDGVDLSNTLLLEKYFGWRGILIEPNPDYSAALAVNRSATIHHGCVGPRTGEPVEFWITNLPELSSIGRYAGDDCHAQLRQTHKAIPMSTIALNDLLEECGAPKEIDYVSLDTEGSELDILSSFDFERFQVRAWTVEHNFSANKGAIDDLMLRHGYRQRFPEWSRHDAWYVRSSSEVSI